MKKSNNLNTSETKSEKESNPNITKEDYGTIKAVCYSLKVFDLENSLPSTCGLTETEACKLCAQHLNVVPAGKPDGTIPMWFYHNTETYWSYPDAIFHPHNEFVVCKYDFGRMIVSLRFLVIKTWPHRW